MVSKVLARVILPRLQEPTWVSISSFNRGNDFYILTAPGRMPVTAQTTKCPIHILHRGIPHGVSRRTENCSQFCNDLVAQTSCCLLSMISPNRYKPLSVTTAPPQKHSNFPCVTRDFKQGCVLAPNVFSIYFSAIDFVAFRPLPAFCSTHVTLESFSVYLVSKLAVRSTMCLYVKYLCQRHCLCCPQ